METLTHGHPRRLLDGPPQAHHSTAVALPIPQLARRPSVALCRNTFGQTGRIIANRLEEKMSDRLKTESGSACAGCTKVGVG